jgi:hypothetical protein
MGQTHYVPSGAAAGAPALEEVEAPRLRTLTPYTYIIVLALWLGGMLLLRPFVPVLMEVMGAKAASLTMPRPWTVSVIPLALLLVGCFLHRRSGLPATPLLEWLMAPRGSRTPLPRVWLPGFLAALVCAALAVTGALVEGMMHRQAPLIARLLSGNMPHALLLKVLAIAPVGSLAAALNEEAVFRFAALSIMMGVISVTYRGAARWNNGVAFWLVNVAQAALFGYVHVASGLVASSSGGVVLQTAIASQTWAGLILGYVYRRWGLEAAMFTHFVADTFALGGVALWALA